MRSLRRLAAGAVAFIAGLSMTTSAFGVCLNLEKGRIYGANRIDTSIAIAKEAFPGQAQSVYLARMDVFADALAGGALTKGGIYIYMPGSEVLLKAAIDQVNAPKVMALGGPSAVSEDVLDQAALRTQCGETAKITEEQVCQALIDKINANTHGYAPGKPLKQYRTTLQNRAEGMWEDDTWEELYPLTKYYSDNAYNRSFERFVIYRSSGTHDGICGEAYEGYGRINTTECNEEAACVIDHIRNSDIFLPHQGRTSINGECTFTLEGASLATDSNTRYGIAVEITPNQVRYAWKAS